MYAGGNPAEKQTFELMIGCANSNVPSAKLGVAPVVKKEHNPLRYFANTVALSEGTIYVLCAVFSVAIALFSSKLSAFIKQQK